LPTLRVSLRAREPLRANSRPRPLSYFPIPRSLSPAGVAGKEEAGYPVVGTLRDSCGGDVHPEPITLQLSQFNPHRRRVLLVRSLPPKPDLIYLLLYLQHPPVSTSAPGAEGGIDGKQLTRRGVSAKGPLTCTHNTGERWRSRSPLS